MAVAPASPRISICTAIADRTLASRIELTLTQDGHDVLSFTSARQLWGNFPARRPRFVISEVNFADDFSGLDFCRNVRQQYLLPYVYIYLISRRNQMSEIKAALDAGANDYTIKPVSPSQIRTRVLVGLRWLEYIDSITVPCA